MEVAAHHVGVQRGTIAGRFIFVYAAQNSDKRQKSLVIGGRFFASTVMAQYDNLCRSLTLYKHQIELVHATPYIRVNNC